MVKNRLELRVAETMAERRADRRSSGALSRVDGFMGRVAIVSNDLKRVPEMSSSGESIFPSGEIRFEPEAREPEER